MGEENTFMALLSDQRIIFPKNGAGAPRKKYFKSEREKEGQSATNWWPHDKFGHNQGANQMMAYLMGVKNIFSNPKPIELIQNLISVANCKTGDIVLDFFAGSCTTFHASIKSHVNIKSICVQLPEALNPNDVDQKVAYDFCVSNNFPPNIASIGKERIRRVIKKLKDKRQGDLNFENGITKDLGFKVLKLDKSNFRQWQKLLPDTKPKEIADQLSLHIDHIDSKATPEDLLYEILIKAGIAPTEKIETIKLADTPVFSIKAGELLICLESDVTSKLIADVVKAEPKQFICLDAAFHGDDQLKANTAQTFIALNADRDKENQILFKTI